VSAGSRSVHRTAPATRPIAYQPTVEELLAALVVVVLLAALSVTLPLLWLLAGLGVALLIAAVYLHPPLAAYTLLVTTPLVAGIGRGTAIPFMRPHEAIALVVGSGLLLRGAVQLVTRGVRAPRLRTLDATIVAMAVTSSVIPLLWLLARGQEITTDDIQYSLVLWKYYGIYLIFRLTVRTEQEVRRCLWVSMGSAAIVAVIAILQSSLLFGVADFLARYYAEGADSESISSTRGTSTLSNAFAVADLAVFNLAIAVGLLSRGSRQRKTLLCAAGLFVAGIVASGQFSAIIGLLIAVVALGLVADRVRRYAITLLPAAAVVAAVLLKPVVERRLQGFENLTGIPSSWVGRLENLRTYFWPRLFSDFNFVLGVRPQARVHLSITGTEFVWIESGYTWLLWAGGIPFLAAFLAFLWVALRRTARVARGRADAIGVAAIASFTSLVVVGVLMALDPHLTLRGSADLLFALVALANPTGRRLATQTTRWEGR
jgi:hypothetical protein